MWYAYNNAGQKTRVSIASGLDTSGNPVNATYDVIHDYYANGWLQDVKYNSNTIAQYSYDSAGNRTGIAYPNGVSTSYVYDNDPRYRLTGITDSGANMAAFQISYTVDSVGNPLTMTDSTGSSTLPWSYGYDANNRLTSAVPPNPVPSQPAGGAYGYDWVGNRIHPPADPNPMAYNAADQLTSWPGMHGYQYDSAGNLVTVTGAGTASYTYTPAGLLNQATYSISTGSGNHTLTNTWDADSNRVAFSAPSGTWNYEVYDITAGIPAVVEDSAASSIAYYIREPNGALIARYDSTNGMRVLSLRSAWIYAGAYGQHGGRHGQVRLRCLRCCAVARASYRLSRSAVSVRRPARSYILAGRSRTLGCCSLG